MPRSTRVSARKVGLHPGAIIYTGERKVERPFVRVMRYGPDREYEERRIEDGAASALPAPPPPDQPGVTWVDVVGLHDTELVARVGQSFGLHPLAVEDVLSIGSRPKIVEYETYLFATVRMLSTAEDGSVAAEQISLATAPGWVLTFQEHEGDVFEGVRERIRRATTRIRERSAGYLWYALLDAVVDHYFLVLENLSTEIEELEKSVWSGNLEGSIPEDVQWFRDEVNLVRRAVMPLRLDLDILLRDVPPQIDEATVPFLRDLQDHLHQLFDALEAMREMLGAILDAYLSLLAARTNDIMKVLTIMASIFIPLTFIAGIYGMNFEHMPELKIWWAYPALWVVWIAIGVSMLLYFRRRGWM